MKTPVTSHAPLNVIRGFAPCIQKLMVPGGSSIHSSEAVNKTVVIRRGVYYFKPNYHSVCCPWFMWFKQSFTGMMLFFCSALKLVACIPSSLGNLNKSSAASVNDRASKQTRIQPISNPSIQPTTRTFQ